MQKYRKTELERGIALIRGVNSVLDETILDEESLYSSYVSIGGGQGGYDPPLSPRSPHPLPPLREVKIGKIFEIVT